MTRKTQLESKFQKEVKDDLERELPGCVIIKGNSAYRQGVPDWLVLHQRNWAFLEVKREEPATSDFQTNQEHYVNQFDEMSFAAVIYPENKQEVIDALCESFGAQGSTCVSKRI